jgi:hypothetical protein
MPLRSLPKLHKEILVKNSDVDYEELEKTIEAFGKACQKMADIVKRVMPSLAMCMRTLSSLGDRS